MLLALQHLTVYWPATSPSLAQEISSGLASWDRLFQAALEAEHGGFAVSTGLSSHCGSVIFPSPCLVAV